ncbi:hypothetical protein JK635_07885 [Neobacillus sp. YIM B02564]|uniref:Uncharacterized protein n=1 Tax=Neobacillus paridis TaxID=2803862 RepID=A0ABS1TLE1_9BACI|nr:hypothetical protein [Neobacillus paridis]MBL4952130.1 hypothetical protein [Neobacillus paridis]
MSLTVNTTEQPIDVTFEKMELVVENQSYGLVNATIKHAKDMVTVSSGRRIIHEQIFFSKEIFFFLKGSSRTLAPLTSENPPQSFWLKDPTNESLSIFIKHSHISIIPNGVRIIAKDENCSIGAKLSVA